MVAEGKLTASEQVPGGNQNKSNGQYFFSFLSKVTLEVRVNLRQQSLDFLARIADCNLLKLADHHPKSKQATHRNFVVRR
jgi:hypothetical protein